MEYIKDGKAFGKPRGIGMPQVFLFVLLGHVVLIGGVFGYYRVKDRWGKAGEEGGPAIGFRIGGIPKADDPAGRIRPVDRGPLSQDAVRLAQRMPIAPDVEGVTEGGTLRESGETPAVAEAAAPEATEAPVAREYVVRQGDALSRIARRHGVSVAALRDANGIASDVIRVGQRLVVPASGRMATVSGSAEATAYVVGKGDTLGAIARRFGVALQDVIRANGIENANQVRVGKRLIIPAAGASRPNPREEGKTTVPSVAMSG